MNSFLLRKKYLFILPLLSFILLNYGCQKSNMQPPGKLTVNSIFIKQTQHTQYLDTSQPIIIFNHPNFDINDPSTRTGDVEQYVIHRYTYTVQCHVTNSGKGMAHDAELDVGYFYDDGTDVFETLHIGDIASYGEQLKSIEIVSYNKQLEECGAEVYWYDF